MDALVVTLYVLTGVEPMRVNVFRVGFFKLRIGET